MFLKKELAGSFLFGATAVRSHTSKCHPHPTSTEPSRLDSITMPASPRRSKRRFSSTSIGTTAWSPPTSVVTSVTCKHEDPPVQPLAYASLPPTPISSPPACSPLPSERSLPSDPQSHQPLFSLWDYLREELLATDFDSHQELKWERVSNFLSIPFAIEKASDDLFHEHLCCLIVLLDCRLWLFVVLGLFPLYIHDPAYPLRYSGFAFHIQRHHLVQITPAFFPEG